MSSTTVGKTDIVPRNSPGRMIDLSETECRPVLGVMVLFLYRGEGLLRERAPPSPLSALFGYFLREQKVTRGAGAQPP